MFGMINSVELPAPSSFVESKEVIGGYNVTLTGAKRRYIKAVKKTWKIGYDMLSVDTYNSLLAVYNTLIPINTQASQPYLVFILIDPTFGVTSESVHMDISDRTFIPGTNLLSSVEITFMQI